MDYPMAMEDPRFWARVNKTRRCWLWTGTKTPSGYGNVCRHVDGVQRMMRAHRYAYEMLVGPIPAGHHIHHLCSNRACVRPEHLQAMPAHEHDNVPRNPRGRSAAGGTMMERGEGVWRLRFYVGHRDGRPIQASRTVRGTRRQAAAALKRWAKTGEPPA